MLLVIQVLALVNSAVSPLEFSSAMHLVVFPVTLVFGSIGPLEDPFSMLLASQVLTIVKGTIRPLLLAEALLLVLMPAPFVSGSFGIKVLSFSVCLIVDPLALIDIPISKYEPSIA
jgi:hypothetical protein